MKRDSQIAFSLIEVILALALFSISVVVLTQSFLNGFLAMESVHKKDVFVVERDRALDDLFKVQDKEKLREGGKLTTFDDQILKWKVKSYRATKVLDLFEYTISIKTNDGKRLVRYLVKNPTLYELGEREKLLEKKQRKLKEKRHES